MYGTVWCGDGKVLFGPAPSWTVLHYCVSSGGCRHLDEHAHRVEPLAAMRGRLGLHITSCVGSSQGLRLFNTALAMVQVETIQFYKHHII